MRILFLLACIGLATPSNSARAAEEVGVAPVPDWVDTIELREFEHNRNDDHQQGLALLLNDYQVRKSTTGYDYAHRIAYWVIDRSGLEAAAALSREFDPQSEALTFNFVRVTRDDATIDRLPEASISEIRQERGLGAGTLDGRITALIQLEDVRVGDLIDYSVSGVVETPLWPNDYFNLVGVESPVPIAQLHFKWTGPASMPIYVRSIATEVTADMQHHGESKSLVIHLIDPDPVQVEPITPPDYVDLGQVAITSFEAWSDVVDWALPVFETGQELPAEYRARLDEIAADLEDPGDRAIAATRLVQEEIRYLGLEMGLGSHVPRTPEQTIARGYGDCKDKSVLLVQSLRYLGIDAVSGLTSIFSGQLLPRLRPSIGAFDHMIVGFSIGEREYWVDPTLTHQGGTLSTMAELGYGHVLPIREGQESLLELALGLPDAPNYEIIEDFDLPADDKEDMRLTVTQVYRRSHADFFRSSLAGASRAQMSEVNLGYYTSRFAGIREEGALDLVDDLAENVVTATSRFVMSADDYRLAGMREEIRMFAIGVATGMPSQADAVRQAPVALPYGAFRRHVVRVSEIAAGEFLPEDIEHSGNGIHFKQQFRSGQNEIEIDQILRVEAKQVLPAEVRDVNDLADLIIEELEYLVYPGSGKGSLAGQLGIDEYIPANLEEKFVDASRLFDDEHFVGALTLLNEILATLDQNTEFRGAVLQLQGATLMSMRRYVAAIESYAEGLRLFEATNIDPYMRYVWVLNSQRDYTGVVNAISLMLSRNPSLVDELEIDWLRNYFRWLVQNDRRDDANELYLAVAAAAHESGQLFVANSLKVFRPAIEFLNSKGRYEESALYLDYLPSPTTLARLLVNVEAEGIWKAIETKAGQGLEAAVRQNIEVTRARHREFPDDYDVLWDYLHALRVDGQYEEALAVSGPAISNWALIDAVGADAFWVVNAHAQLLADLGRVDEADAFFERLISLGISNHSELMRIALNRAELNLIWERPNRALSVVDEILALDTVPATDFGWQTIRFLQVCSLHESGQFDRAKEIFEREMLPKAADNREALTKAYLCFGEIDKAAETLIARLEDSDARDSALEAFIQTSEPGPQAPFLGELLRRAHEAESLPIVQQTRDRYGRSITVAGSGAVWAEF